MGKLIATVFLTLVLIVALFEIRLGGDADATGPVPDPAVEAAYDACFQEKDDEIHATAFGTIDNPDVQREFIASNRARAARECRELHPERLITVEPANGSGGIEFRPRFW